MGREKNERHIYTRILADLQSCFLYTMYAGLCSLIANLMPFVFGPNSQISNLEYLIHFRSRIAVMAFMKFFSVKFYFFGKWKLALKANK